MLIIIPVLPEGARSESFRAGTEISYVFSSRNFSSQESTSVLSGPPGVLKRLLSSPQKIRLLEVKTKCKSIALVAEGNRVCS